MVLRLEKHLDKDNCSVPEYDSSYDGVVEGKTGCPLNSDLRGVGQGHEDGDGSSDAPLLSSGPSESVLRDDDKEDVDDGDDEDGDDGDALDQHDDTLEYNFVDDDNTDDELRDRFDGDEGDATAEDDDDYDDDDAEEIDEDAFIPDGGWGWVVCFGSFMVNFICDGTMFSFGILLLDLLKDIGSDKGTTSWAGGALVGFSMVAGPFVSYLLKSYSLRQVTMVGAFLTMVGFTASAFSVNVYMFILTYGVIGGTGICLSFLPAIIVVGLYFNKKRALATGIATSGSGLGTFAYAYIANSLLEAYGWRGTVLILGALVLNSAVCGMFFRPIKTSRLATAAAKKKKTKSKIDFPKDTLKPERQRDNGSISSGYSSDKAFPLLRQDQPLLPSPLVVVVNDDEDGGGDADLDCTYGSGDVGWGGAENCKCNDVEHFGAQNHITSSASESSISRGNTLSPNMTSSRSHHNPLNNHRRSSKDTSGSLFKDAILNHQRQKHMSESSSVDDHPILKCSDSSVVSPSPYCLNNNSKYINANKRNNNDNNSSVPNEDTESNENLPIITINSSSNCNADVLSDILGNCTNDSNVITIEDMDSGELVYRQVVPTSTGTVNQRAGTAQNQCSPSSFTHSKDRNYDYNADPNDDTSELHQIRQSFFTQYPQTIIPSSTKPEVRNGKSDNYNYARLYQSAGHLHTPSKYSTTTQCTHRKTSHDFPSTRLLNSEYKLDDYPNNHLGVTSINHSPRIHSKSSGHLKSYIHGSGQDLKSQGPSDMTSSRSAFFHHQISKGLLRPILRQDIYYGGSVNHLTASKQFGSMASFVAAMTRTSSEEDCGAVSEGPESVYARGRRTLLSCCPSAFLFKNRSFVLLLITFTMWTAQSVSLTYIPDLAVSRGISRPDAAFLISIVGIANVLGRLVAGLVTDILRVPASSLYIVGLSTAAVINFTIAYSFDYTLLCFCSTIFGLCMGVAVSMRTIVLAEELGIQFLTQSFGIVAMFQGVAFTVNPPIAGKLIDDSDSFKPPFIMVSAMYAISALAVVMVVVFNRFRPITTFTTTSTSSSSANNINIINNNNNTTKHHQFYNRHHHTSSVMLGDDTSYIVEVAD